ncbi:uncharacterized protein LOC120525639 [Polypterus senegalus]|uniref:uncharacterized protein LOC120525639 n=1 Tax=Polypterus senegalus TaxID=55291 RepID=UPI001963A943|nr:uncharacterized protein LOC120525639 [Polypterus senegalus]
MWRLQYGLMLLLAAALSGVSTQSLPAGIWTGCQGSLMVLSISQTYLQGQYFQINLLTQNGVPIPMTLSKAVRCGYSEAIDDWGNILAMGSILGCFVTNIDDRTFSQAVQVLRSPNANMSPVTSFSTNVTCTYSWTEREVMCEGSYMEVSVRTNVAPIVQNPNQDWSGVNAQDFPSVSIWQVVFGYPTKNALTVSGVNALGYGVGTTPSRIWLRSPYNTSQTQIQMVNSVPLSVLDSVTFYKQRWMILLIDTSVACPIDGVSFTQQDIVWIVPRFMAPLANATGYADISIQMGINGLLLDSSTLQAHTYSLNVNQDLITVTIPIGAPGGYYKSHAPGNVYGLTYSITPLLVHVWQDDVYDRTKQTIRRPVTTPFMPKPLDAVDNTIPTSGYFNVSVGSVLNLDVQLIGVSVGPLAMPVTVANSKGYNVQAHGLPTGFSNFSIQVPFNDPNVIQKVIAPDTRTYTLNVTFFFNIIPEDAPFSKTAIVEITLHDIVPPTVEGYCSSTDFYLTVFYGSLGQNWTVYIGGTPVAQLLSYPHGYDPQASSFWITIPYNTALGAYEDIYASEVRRRLDVMLVHTQGIVTMNFSLSCSFPLDLIGCLTNGTMTALAIKMESTPGILPSQLTLRDPNCRPQMADAMMAVFSFDVNTCGTTRKFDGNIMTYENDVLFPASGEIYWLRIACKYMINDAELVEFGFQDNPAPVLKPGLGLIDVVMSLAMDASYINFYNAGKYPVAQFLRSPLYFEVQLLNTQDPQVELFLEECWATTSPDPTALPKWELIVDSCANAADSYKTLFEAVVTNARVVFPSHYKRFQVKMFSFTQDDMALEQLIYFHCEVVICTSTPPYDQRCSGQCIPGGQRSARSVEKHNLSKKLVSSGPIAMQTPQKNVWNPLVAAVAFFSLILLVAGIFCWKEMQAV